MKTFILNSLVLTGLLMPFRASYATVEGIPDNYLIQGHSRPCCSFVDGVVSSSLGIFAITSPEKMNFHRFGGARKEHTGIAYGCKTGFIDTSHMRDNIDWTGHLIRVMPEILGMEKEFPIRKEHVRRNIFMKKIDDAILESMTQEDYALLAQRISYDLSVWHEILTGMGISSFDPTSTFKDEMSTFSLEDNFSNLLGTYIGAEAALSPLPFNEAVAQIIQKRMEEFEVVSSLDARAAHRSVFRKWWKRGPLQIPSLKQVNKRHMDPYALEGVTSFRVPEPEVAGCEQKSERALALAVPSATSLGHKLTEFYEIRIPVSKRIRKFMIAHDLTPPAYLTQNDFPLLIGLLKTKYHGIFGEGFDHE